MASNMRTSRAGLDVIKAFEGFRPRYQKLPNGRWIIGYGHVRANRDETSVSESEAEAVLREYDLPPLERLVMDTVLAPLNQNEFDALVSLAHNVGRKAFVSSDVVTLLNAGNRLAAAGAFDHWRRARIGGRIQIVDALVRRRACEKALFLKAPGQMPVASRHIYRPLHETARLPAPARPREILVDHTPAAAKVEPEVRSIQVQPDHLAISQPLSADDSVRRRLVRIIGEDGDQVSQKPATTDGASPEEITAAVSALAGSVDNADSVTKSVWPSHEDLPPPPFTEMAMDAGTIAPDLQADPDRIDDLEVVEVTPDDIARAVASNDRFEAGIHSDTGLIAAPFGIMAIVGFCLAGFGAFRQSQQAENLNGVEAYLAPFMMLVGGLLFTVMTVYFVRALLTRES